MVKLEIFYDSSVDGKTPELVDEIKYKFSGKAEIQMIDTSEEQVPEKYGTINPPAVVINGKQIIKLESKESLKEIAAKAIF